VLDWLEDVARSCELEPESFRSLQLAIEEVFANCVRHNPSGAGPIEIEIENDDGHVRVSIVDPDTDGFDLRTQEDPEADLPIEERTPGGLGIPLIRKICDDIEYRHEGRTSVTVLVKTLSQR
jgi:anti-sigma regulatory factor (Ser/Thr protein kinase)